MYARNKARLRELDSSGALVYSIYIADILMLKNVRTNAHEARLQELDLACAPAVSLIFNRDFLTFQERYARLAYLQELHCSEALFRLTFNGHLLLLSENPPTLFTSNYRFFEC